MTRGFKLAGLLFVSASALSSPVRAAPARPAAQSTADARLKALYDGYSTWDATESAVFENKRGEIEAADHLPKVDLASQQRRAEHLQELLTKLNAIPEAQLSPGERVNADVFRTLLENAISDAHFRLWEIPFNSDSSFWT